MVNYSNNYLGFTNRNLVLQYIPDPTQQSKIIEHELRDRFNIPDPEKRPEKEPGDGFVIVGAILGVIIGIIFGYLLGKLFDTYFVLGIVVGMIVGGIVGTLIGTFVKRYINKKASRYP